MSDAGRLRPLNEDGVLVDADLGFALLADGMGGFRAGDVASRLALETIAAHLRAPASAGAVEVLEVMDATEATEATETPAAAPLPQRVDESVSAANAAVYAATQKQTVRTGMGTTLAMAVFDEHRVVLAHVGDSRIYRLRDGHLDLLTRDDSILNDQVELGLIAADEVGESHNRRMVTQTLGMAAQVAAHVREEALCIGDVYLLCSDGLNDQVGDGDIECIVDALKTNLPLTATHLVQLANDSGGYDNVSVVLIRVLDKVPEEAPRGLLGRLFRRRVH